MYVGSSYSDKYPVCMAVDGILVWIAQNLFTKIDKTTKIIIQYITDNIYNKIIWKLFLCVCGQTKNSNKNCMISTNPQEKAKTALKNPEIAPIVENLMGKS